MEFENRLVDVEYVASALGVSRPSAYRAIRNLNAELAANGIRTIRGKVNLRYFEMKYLAIPGEDGGRHGGI